MPQSEPVSILLVNESSEEIKLTTLTFRGFFPNCRVEAVYSLEEAFQWAYRAPWLLILIDDRLHAQRSSPILPELKRFAPYTTLVLQTERVDTAAALTAIQDGADFLLYKKSPAFLTELMLYAKGLLESHAYRMMLERIQERHNRLADLLSDILYELDQTGRFVYLSPLSTDILGYDHDELIGAHYSIIVPPDQRDQVRHSFHDRRTGPRATRQREIDLLGKTFPNKPSPSRISVLISAKGLYDSERRYFGTLGILHIQGHHRCQESPLRRSEQCPQEVDRLLGFAARFSAVSRRLHASYDVIRGQSKLLVKALRVNALREARLIEQVESLATSAAGAMQLGDDLVRATEEMRIHRDTINDIIDTVLDSGHPSLPITDRFERVYATDLPFFIGNTDCLRQILRILLSHAQRSVAATGTRRRLKISTVLVVPDGASTGQRGALFSTAQPQFEICIQETDVITTTEELPLQTTGDLAEAYVLIRQLGGRCDVLAPVGGRLSMTVWIPVQPDPESYRCSDPSSSSTVFSDAPNDSRFQVPSGSRPSAWPETSLPVRQVLQSLPDRRTCIRTAVNLPTRLAMGNLFRQGAMTDLSSKGASLEVEGLLPPLEQHPVHLIFKTTAGSFEIQAAAFYRGEGPRKAGIERQTSRLAFLFSSLDDNQEKVLASYIEEARARTLAVTVEALFSPMDMTDALSTSPSETSGRGTDHRETMRVRVSLPVRIELPSRDASEVRPHGIVVNFSRGGACIQTSFSLNMTDKMIALHFSSTGVHNHPRVHEPESPEAILIGRIVRSTVDSTVPSDLKSDPSQPGIRIGIRFVRPVPFAEREVNRVIAQHIGTSMDSSGFAGRPSVVSTRRECRNARHQVIAVTDDHARDQISPGTPILLIIPGFGCTQTDYVPLSYYLATNRFRVLRYDHTNHVGQSDGEILQITLRGMQADLQNVLDFVHATWPTASVTILAEDIAARVAVKVMARSKSSSRLFLLNPVLDIDAALSTPSRADVIGGYRQNLRRGVVNLWGLNVNVDQFVGDAIAGEYTDVASSAADFARLQAHPVILTSPRSHHPIEHIFGQQDMSARAMGVVPVVIPLQADVSGESGTYDERHVIAFRTICKLISSPTIDGRVSTQMRESHPREVREQRRLEQERIRIRHHVSQATRNALSVAHGAQLPQFGHLPDYWTLINELHRRILPLDPGMTVLDIGCGVGDFVRALLTNHVYRSVHQDRLPDVPLRYIGLDQSYESLKVARQQIHTFAQELLGTLKTAIPMTQFIETHWLQTDWTSPLPFKDGAIDRVICQLSLPFAASPLDCLRQVLRVLHSDGTALITCFQPHTDLSTLFLRHYRAAGHDEFSSQTQIVLHFLGRVREAIRHGTVHHYERNELAGLLSHAGAGVFQIYHVLDNQLLLAIVRKAKSTG